MVTLNKPVRETTDENLVWKLPYSDIIICMLIKF